nr:adhesion G-protein coupled receptor G4 isoform X2 [Hydra vulgaris]
MRCLACMILISLLEISTGVLVEWNAWGEWTNNYRDYFKRSRNCSVSTADVNFDVIKCCYNDSLSEWSSWSSCTKICQLNETISSISVCTCFNTAIDGNCTGAAVEQKKDCSFQDECSDYLSDWSIWSNCSVTCQNVGSDHFQTRFRTCLRIDGCLNAITNEKMDCDPPDCTDSDCRSTGCEGENEECASYDNFNYFCNCVSNYFRKNGTCTECDRGCNNLMKCRNYNGFNDCECFPNFFLVDEKCTDYLSGWSSWSDCSNASNRTRNRTCVDEYFGKNCTGSVAEQTQSCPGFAYTVIIYQLNKTWNDFDLSSQNNQDLFSWFKNFTNEFEQWFKRFTPFLLNKSDLFENYYFFASFHIWYTVDKKDLSQSCKQIESSLADLKQILNCDISLLFIAHSDCCFSKIYDPFDAFMIEYFTGLESLNFSLADGGFNLSCNYNESKFVNVYCVVLNLYDSWYTQETFSDIAMWVYFEVFNCPAETEFSQYLIELNKTITSDNADGIAANLSSVLNENANVSIVDIQLITYIITGIIKESWMPTNVTENVLSSLSALLNQNKTLLSEANSKLNTSNELLSQLDKMAAKQFTNVSVSTQNLAFASYVNEKNSSDVYIYSDNNTTNNNNLSIIISSNDPKNGSESYLPYITLPSQLFFDQNKTLVYSYIYKEVDLFLNMKNRTGNINSVVLSATLKNVIINESNSPIIMRFSKNSNVPGNTSCGFFDTKKKTWSTEGCKVTKNSLSVVICECNHLTNFALLLNVAQSSSSNDPLSLTIITWIGCGLSIAGLFLTIVSYSAFSKLRKKLAPKILLSLCISLMSTLIIFLALADRTKPHLLCKVVASLLQFFVLSTFFWMAIEGLNFYRMFVKVFHGSSSSRIFFLKASVFSWGIPLVFTIATAVSKPDSLGPENVISISTNGPQVCVVRGNPFYFGILLPICVVMAGNICALIFVLRGISGNSNLNNKIDIKKKIRIAFACSALLGLTWIFAILAVGKATAVFQWLFCIFNSLQGFFIFLFYTVENKQVKEEWMLFLHNKFGCFKSFSLQKSQNVAHGSVRRNTLETKIE